MAVRNIYIRKDDENLWTWADAEAKKVGVALSVWLTRAIRNQKIGAASGEAPALTTTETLEMARDQIIEVLTELRQEES